MSKRIALLSNVNMNFVIRQLKKELKIYEPEGYGNELGILMNPASSYHTFAPEITFLVMELMELLEHDLSKAHAMERIEGWFDQLESCIEARQIYYVSDAFLWGAELLVVQDVGLRARLEACWQKRLEAFVSKHSNVRIFPYREMIARLGEQNAFSLKMWYMGKIPLNSEAQSALGSLIIDKVRIETLQPKKVLLLDLDNTLWGGLAGEADHTPVQLSEEHGGLAYKNLQRVILQMQRQGVILGIVSKNNEEDALAILEKHPHMVLTPECFAIRKINWRQKHENIMEIATQLNLGLDSFVFFDDNEEERQLVSLMLPQVVVPDFPRQPEDLPGAMAEIYHTYFAKPAVTREDLEKTDQYAANARRNAFEKQAGSFEEYLKQLQIVMERVEAADHLERLVQLINKTNQFNLTTKRYSRQKLQQIVEDTQYRSYLYRVADRFGDQGIVAAVLVDLSDGQPEVDTFVMSCRVMGKNIEYAIMEEVEKDLQSKGYRSLCGRYLPTAKNKPVEELFDALGYTLKEKNPEGEKVYEIALDKTPCRNHFVQVQ